jgi:hypothetical protein
MRAPIFGTLRAREKSLPFALTPPQVVLGVKLVHQPHAEPQGTSKRNAWDCDDRHQLHETGGRFLVSV